ARRRQKATPRPSASIVHGPSHCRGSERRFQLPRRPLLCPHRPRPHPLGHHPWHPHPERQRQAPHLLIQPQAASPHHNWCFQSARQLRSHRYRRSFFFSLFMHVFRIGRQWIGGRLTAANENRAESAGLADFHQPVLGEHKRRAQRARNGGTTKRRRHFLKRSEERRGGKER